MRNFLYYITVLKRIFLYSINIIVHLWNIKIYLHTCVHFIQWFYDTQCVKAQSELSRIAIAFYFDGLKLYSVKEFTTPNIYSRLKTRDECNKWGCYPKGKGVKEGFGEVPWSTSGRTYICMYVLVSTTLKSNCAGTKMSNVFV